LKCELDPGLENPGALAELSRGGHQRGGKYEEEFDMKDATKQHENRCPVCAKVYPEEDNYCGDDGSVLEQARGKHLSRSAGTQMTADDLNAESISVLKP